MSNWITLTIDDLASYLNARQLQALRTAALDPGQGDPVVDVINDTLRAIRLAIASCPKNRLSSTPNTIPPELRGEAAALIIGNASTRLSIALALNEDQKLMIQRADSLLRQIARCDRLVTRPTDPEPEPSASGGAGVQVVTSRPPVAGRQQLDGL